MKRMLLDPKRFQKRKSPNHKHNWQLLGEEISIYFNKPLYWLFHRFPEDRIVDCYKFCKREGIGKYQVLIALLKRKK